MRRAVTIVRDWWRSQPRDLVERLREDMWGDGAEAADEIDRLQAFRIVGEIAPAIVERLQAIGAAPQETAITILASEVAHIARDSKAAAGRAIALSDLLRLPDLLAAPERVLREMETGLLLFVFTPSDPAEARLGKLVVQVDTTRKLRDGGGRERRVVTTVRSAGLVPAQALDNAGVYQRLDLPRR